MLFEPIGNREHEELQGYLNLEKDARLLGVCSMKIVAERFSSIAVEVQLSACTHAIVSDLAPLHTHQSSA